jgi:uncharacterized protein (TIGR02246 family)
VSVANSSRTTAATLALAVCSVAVKAERETETAVIELFERFCSAVAARNREEEVLSLFLEDADAAMVTSEDALVRGPDELRAFIRGYFEGGTTYSWCWDSCQVSQAGAVAWLLAVGFETAATANDETQTPYRMSLVCEQRGGRWLLAHVHGSSPHHGE